MSDLISRKSTLKHIEKIRQSVQMMDDTHRASITMNGMYLCEKAVRNQPSAQPDLITKIQNGIKATNADDVYSCGMRNGMRWCISLIDGKEPLYENCPSAQPDIVCKDCKWCEERYDSIDKTPYWMCKNWDSQADADGFCYKAERRTDGRD